MKLIVGLGNPGRQYAGNRHNVGFQCIDLLAERHDLTFGKQLHKAAVATGPIGQHRVILAKPQTFMNLSGHPVSALLAWYKLSASDLIVVHDELDLPLGKIRIRDQGGAGGHNGIKSIVGQLGTHQFSRVRIGIGRPPGRPSDSQVTAHVLGDFAADEQPDISEARSRAVDALECLLAEGLERAMNRFNG